MPCHEHPTMMGQLDLIERIAEELVQCCDLTVIAPLWQGVMGLGLTAPQWVEALVSKWLWPSLALPEFPPQVENVWHEIIKFASEHPNWRKNSSFAGADADELWTKLLGVDDSCFRFWRVDHAAVIDRAASLIHGKIAELVASPSIAGPLLRWISRGPGRTVYPRGVAVNTYQPERV